LEEQRTKQANLGLLFSTPAVPEEESGDTYWSNPSPCFQAFESAHVIIQVLHESRLARTRFSIDPVDAVALFQPMSKIVPWKLLFCGIMESPFKGLRIRLKHIFIPVRHGWVSKALANLEKYVPPQLELGRP
jgi:hypothetical protein